LDNIYRVSELLHIPAKDASKDSFPGDHGMMLLIFPHHAALFRKSAFEYALIIFVVCLPTRNDWRHWFTDIAVGSFLWC
jgi:membrane-associated phospholipid phosphatase